MARPLLEIIMDMIILVISNTFGTIKDLAILFWELITSSIFYFQIYGFWSLLVSAPILAIITYLFVRMVWSDSRKEIKLLITAGIVLVLLTLLSLV